MIRILLLSFFVLTNCFAGDAVLSSKTGKVTFLAQGNPGFMKIEGESEGKFAEGGLKFSPGALDGTFKFDLRSLTTGIETRDEHMKEKYLEVQKFPEAILILDTIKGELDPQKDYSGNFSGNLTLHGTTKKISGKFSYDADMKTVDAEFEIKVSDYGIDIPSYMGVTVADTVSIKVRSVFK